MTKVKHYMALDYGIGRCVATAGSFDGKRLGLEMMHRFDVKSTQMLGISYWDFPAMLIHAKRGLYSFTARHGKELGGVGINSWAGDFGLLDKTGQLLSNPINFLNTYKMGMNQKLHNIFPQRSLYQRTGVQSRREITLYQLFAMAQMDSPLLDRAVTMLLLADLVSYFLTGTPVQEYTLATTSGMYDSEIKDWSRDIILGANIPPIMVPEIVAPGTVIGPLLDSVAVEVGLGQTPVIAPASHGTAGALAAVPAKGSDWLCITSGFWNQVTVELANPIINDASFAAEFSNLGGVDGTTRLRREILGMGGIEECIKLWSREDARDISMGEILRLSESVKPLERVVNLGDPKLVVVGRRPETVNEILNKTGQPPICTRGEIVRTFLDSLVLSQRHAINQMREVTGRRFDTMHFVGRGVNFAPLGQALADATGMVVKAGPVEAKSVGNVVMQMMALGDLGSLSDARDLVSRSFDVAEYTPKDRAMWDDAYEKYLKMLK